MKSYYSLLLKAGILLSTILILFGVLYSHLLSDLSQEYYKERTQLLNKELAQFTTDHVITFDSLGNVNEEVLGEIMHSMMIINPSVEVYLLDLNGKILKHVAPHKEVVLEEVSMLPVKAFIINKTGDLIEGDDPRNPGEKNIFSAAEIIVAEKVVGYYYIILSGENERGVSAMISESYAFQKGFWLILFSVLLGALLAFFGLSYLTKNLKRISRGMQKFRSGDYSSRIITSAQSDFSELSIGFNSMAEKIEGHINEMQSVDLLRRELIANVSHDLRTPLSVATGYIESLNLAEEKLSNEERKAYLLRSHKSLKKLGALIEQLFEYSKLQSNHIELNKEPFLIQELISDLAQRNELTAKQKEINLELEIQEGVPLINADIGMVERAIQNLVDNAISYTENQGTVSIKLEKEGEEVIVSVKDSGPGIPKGEREFIFDRYRRGKAGMSSSSSNGLGLAIVKRIMDVHQSKVELLSTSPKGTAIALKLNKLLLA